MKIRVGIFLGIAFVSACSSSTPRAPSASEQGEIVVDEEPAAKKAAAKGEPLAVEALEWGPYPVDDLPSAARGIAWESGYISMRQIKGKDVTDIYDYRWYLSAVASGDTSLPIETTAGCKNWPKKSGLSAGALVEKVTYSGAFSKEASGSGILQVSPKDKDGDFSYIATDELSAVFETAEGEVQGTAPVAPESHNLQLSGAYAGSLNVNTVMATLNSNLEAESADLILSDQGDDPSYNVAVIVFFPGAEAEAASVRCVLKAGETLTIPESEYKTWLPLKGFIAFSAQTDLTTTDADIPFWKSTIRGDGVEDLSIP